MIEPRLVPPTCVRPEALMEVIAITVPAHFTLFLHSSPVPHNNECENIEGRQNISPTAGFTFVPISGKYQVKCQLYDGDFCFRTLIIHS